jgi:hypothetical protein
MGVEERLSLYTLCSVTVLFKEGLWGCYVQLQAGALLSQRGVHPSSFGSQCDAWP